MEAKTILVIDDNPLNLKLVRVLLAAEGYIVRTAADASQAYQVLRECRPHLILMDIQLPGIDGLELTRRLKTDPATSDITIVGLTAYAMKGDEERIRAAGCDGYIPSRSTQELFRRWCGNIYCAGERRARKLAHHRLSFSKSSHQVERNRRDSRGRIVHIAAALISLPITNAVGFSLRSRVGLPLRVKSTLTLIVQDGFGFGPLLILPSNFSPLFQRLAWSYMMALRLLVHNTNFG